YDPDCRGHGMPSNPNASSAPAGVDAADGPPDQAMHEKRRTAADRRARERRKHLDYALIGFVALAIMIIFGMQQGWLPTPREMVGKPRDGKSDAFVETRQGQIRLPVSGQTCRELMFNNQNGRFSENGTTRCEQIQEETGDKRGTGNRINAVRDFFTR